LAGGRPLAIANLEIDRFMEVTTALGFEFSDALLLAASGRIKTAWPDSLVARIGNARIGVCLPDVSTQRELQAALAIIRVAFDEALLLDRRRLVLNIRLGGALAAPGTSAQQTMREAEIALHASAKNTERWSIFDEAMQQALVASQEIEHELRRLLVDGESSRRGGLSLAYQPIVTLADTGGRQLAGFEALLRWNHPKRGSISPATFVPIAEATGLIHRIGGFVLSEAIEALARWRDAPSCRSDGLFMSVNVSLRQLATGDFPDQVATTLRQFDLDPRLLKLEITESTAMSDVDATLAQLDRLRGIGASLSIDDFGTGYSSLAYLHRLPVDTIKIDRAFVSQVHVRPTNAEIIKTITAMSRAIGFNVVAEGVECAEEESILRAAGCNFGQGYLYGRGVPEADVLPLLAH
ncbi:MAG: EAL domain-containing protein, partial [Alphaproteobacteria bacterium]|nr:EAL domain-containing protein [Alphaproteobacteria bacterium]